MNYEELLETRDARKTTKMRLPLGYFYKRQIDGKYSNFVEFHDELTDHIAFANSVKAEAEAMSMFNNRFQLHFTPNNGDNDEDGIFAIAVDMGNYISLEQLLNENPAMVARKDFISHTIQDIVEITELLNERQIFHVCFAPSNILVRKNDTTIRLLCHGSFYAQLDQEQLYEGLEEFVAPEVIKGGPIDARCDVWSLAKFIAWLYRSSGLPFEMKQVIAKATAENPDERYSSVHDFYQALQTRRTLRHSTVMAVTALLIALSVAGLFFYLLPSPDDIEFVKPVEEPIPDDLMEDNGTLLGIGADADSAAIAAAVARQEHIKDSIGVNDQKMREYNAKAEQIFRKQFTKAADEIISRVYNNDKMNLSEKEFMVRSKAMTEELAKKQKELAGSSNLSTDRTQTIASQIIDQLTTKKMKELDKDYLGIRKKSSNDGEEKTKTDKDK